MRSVRSRARRRRVSDAILHGPGAGRNCQGLISEYLGIISSYARKARSRRAWKPHAASRHLSAGYPARERKTPMEHTSSPYHKLLLALAAPAGGFSPGGGRGHPSRLSSRRSARDSCTRPCITLKSVSSPRRSASPSVTAQSPAIPDRSRRFVVRWFMCRHGTCPRDRVWSMIARLMWNLSVLASGFMETDWLSVDRLLITLLAWGLATPDEPCGGPIVTSVWHGFLPQPAQPRRSDITAGGNSRNPVYGCDQECG